MKREWILLAVEAVLVHPVGEEGLRVALEWASPPRSRPRGGSPGTERARTAEMAKRGPPRFVFLPAFNLHPDGSQRLLAHNADAAALSAQGDDVPFLERAEVLEHGCRGAEPRNRADLAHGGDLSLPEEEEDRVEDGSLASRDGRLVAHGALLLNTCRVAAVGLPPFDLPLDHQCTGLLPAVAFHGRGLSKHFPDKLSGRARQALKTCVWKEQGYYRKQSFGSPGEIFRNFSSHCHAVACDIDGPL